LNDNNNNSHTVLSSVALFTVKQVYSAQVSHDREKISSANKGVNFSHLLKNTGNGDDTYTMPFHLSAHMCQGP